MFLPAHINIFVCFKEKPEKIHNQALLCVSGTGEQVGGEGVRCEIVKYDGCWLLAAYQRAWPHTADMPLSHFTLQYPLYSVAIMSMDHYSPITVSLLQKRRKTERKGELK